MSILLNKESTTPTQLVFYSPRSPSTGVVKVTISHEFIASSIDAFDFTYTTPVHSITSSPSYLSSLAGGETVEINGNFDCSSAKVKIVATRDPCEDHNCHHRATCTPTELDYTCACDSNDSDQGLGYGNGFECYWYVRRGAKVFFDDLTDDFCETSGELLTSLDVNSKAVEEYFHQYLIKAEATLTRGTYVKWYGQWACVINENDENGNPKLTVVGTDKATYTKQ